MCTMRRIEKNIRVIMIAFFAFAFVVSTAGAEVSASYLYDLSSFHGKSPYNWATISVDAGKNEVYVINPTDRAVSIYDENAMEIYSFNDDRALGNIADVTVDEDGNIFILSYKGLEYSVMLSNYRGELMSEIKVKDIPKDIPVFHPERIRYLNKKLYLADFNYLRIIVSDTKGNFDKVIDIGSLLNIEEKKRDESVLGGFDIDRNGNIFFTIPVFALAYKLSPEGEIISFGVPGSAPGRFGIVGGIVTDDKGNYFIADTLRCVVMIFDKDQVFQKEFGYFGRKSGNLIAPKDIALDGNDRLYVSQARKRGISVFKISY